MTISPRVWLIILVVARLAVVFGFVPPEDDHAVVPVRIGGQLTAAVGGQVDVFLVGFPGFSSPLEQTGQVLGGALVGSTGVYKRILVIKNAEVRAGLGPELVGLGRVDVGIVSARRRQHVVAGRYCGEMTGKLKDMGDGGGEKGRSQISRRRRPETTNGM